MNRTHHESLCMFRKVNKVLERNKEILKEHKIVHQTAGEFSGNLKEISKLTADKKNRINDVNGKGVKARDELAMIASELAAAVKAYAYDKRNTLLEAAVDFSYSDIRTAGDAEALHIASLILAELQTNIHGLGAYLVNDMDVEELQEAISRFGALAKSNGDIKWIYVNNTRRLAQLIWQSNDLLKKRLDQLVYRLKRRCPRFYKSYVKARKTGERN
ncbi:MAG: hypothetical protein JXR46_16840 [Calditrichaceae bacterium]|nr:hypothetical protein [Calditrichaceae bacterium]MBN2710715.1 hypothetical protein [Calditrichaceae bacterium]RQV92744.1 MAG: hypothetical protein EH224_14525 [Calditrichota bacterium]